VTARRAFGAPVPPGLLRACGSMPGTVAARTRAGVLDRGRAPPGPILGDIGVTAPVAIR